MQMNRKYFAHLLEVDCKLSWCYTRIIEGCGDYQPPTRLGRVPELVKGLQS
jgi:hypothetical protein